MEKTDAQTSRPRVSDVLFAAPAEEITGVRFGDPENVKNGVSRLYLIKFQSVRPIQEHHPPQCPGI
jgi:hypothetical protein